ncbi:hypothetical protein MLD52_13540 [Puniceicoccaceae bacterium K14]|nr:hypothetical protein [Puniceicoccaceae bacterium K14]
MDDKQLDQSIRDYYLKQELPASSIQRILEQGKAEAALGAQMEEQSEKPRNHWWRQAITFAAAACLMIVLGFQVEKMRTPSNDVDEIAGVVASRHNNNRNFDFAVNSFEDVQSELKDLAFTVQPVLKQKLLSAYEVVGARYCQVHGQQTAHLQVRNRSTGVLCSLFVASLDGNLKGVDTAPYAVELEANSIDMWSDSGRLYALVD